MQKPVQEFIDAALELRLITAFPQRTAAVNSSLSSVNLDSSRRTSPQEASTAKQPREVVCLNAWDITNITLGWLVFKTRKTELKSRGGDWLVGQRSRKHCDKSEEAHRNQSEIKRRNRRNRHKSEDTGTYWKTQRHIIKKTPGRLETHNSSPGAT